MNDSIVVPRLGFVGWCRFLWRQLTSMRTALLLLMLLAIAAVPGSVLPQRRINPGQVQGYLAEHPSLGPWLDRIGGFDVYASPWFSAIYLLLFVSLVGCVLPRSRQHLAAIRAAPPRTPRRLARMPAHLRVESGLAPELALAAARTQLRRRRYRIAAFDQPQGGSLAAERGQLAETGNLAFHLALLGLLVAIAAGSMYSWSGQTLVVTGGTFANTLPRYSSFHAGSRVDDGDLPPFSLRLDDLTVRFEERPLGSQFGAPRDFRATVTVQRSPQAPTRQAVLRVNQPVTVDGTRVFLVGNGYAARVTVRDPAGRAVYSGAVPMLVQDGVYTSGGAIKVPDGLSTQVGFNALFLPTAALNQNGQPISVFPDDRNPRLVLRAFAGDLGLERGRPQSVYVLDASRMKPVRDGNKLFGAVLAPGRTATLPDGLGSISFDGVTRYAALDLRRDPTKVWVLGSALLALAGLVLSLFVRRRRVWVRVLPAGDGGPGSRIELAGLARGDDPRLVAELAELSRAIDPAATDPAAIDPAATALPVDRQDEDRQGEAVGSPARGVRE